MKKEIIILVLVLVAIFGAIFTTQNHASFVEHRIDFNGDEELILADSFSSALNRTQKPVHFMTNAGMFHDDGTTVGLYIENGEEVYPINTDDGTGNFFLKPNGVFWFGNGGVGVEDTQSYIQAGRSPKFATQSGPMLLIEGEINSEFNPESDNLNIRSGVCVLGEEAIFVLSRKEVTFYQTAEYFKDLGCSEALYLDGYISDFYRNGKEVIKKRDDRLGTIFIDYEN